MAKKTYPSDKQDQFMLRLPDGMRDRIKAAADQNGRSMNAEIVLTLEETYPAIDAVDDDHFQEVMGKLRDALYSVDLPERQLDFMWENVSTTLLFSKGGKQSKE